MQINFNQLWKKDLGLIYKEISIDKGKQFKTDIDLKEVKNIIVNYKVNDKSFTDSVEIIDTENNIINVPFESSVLEAGKHELEIIAVMKNGNVLPSSTFTYTVNESLENENPIEAETNYPVLINLINSVEDSINSIEEAINKIPSKEELIGPAGPQGPQGEQGIQGIQGPQGEQGKQGMQGPRGVQGEVGPKGPKGDIGPQGTQGPKGDKGDKGDTGPQGIQGLQGPMGERGIQGEKGDTPSITHLETQIANKSKELDTKFNTLTAKQQQDAEVVTARDGEVSLNARLERDLAKGKIHFVECSGEYISTESEEGYLENVEIKGNTWQDSENLADIRSVGTKVEGQELYEIDVLSRGKNLFNINEDRVIVKGTSLNDSFRVVDNAVEFATPYFVIGNNIVGYKINVKPNTDYKFNFNVDSGKCAVRFYNENLEEIVYKNNPNFTFNSGNSNVVYLQFTSNEWNTLTRISNIQLEEGTQATSFEEYKEDKLTILSPTPLEKVGDVADRIICKDGVWGVEKNIVSGTFEFSGKWAWSGNSFKYTTLKSSIPNFNETYVVSNVESGLWVNANGNIIRSYSSDDNLDYLNSFSEIYIKYPTTQPTFIPLPNSQQIKLRTFADRTYIHFVTEIQPTLKASVPKSLGATVNTHTTQIDNLNKELDRVKKLEESTVSTLTSDKAFTSISETTQGYFEDVKIEGKTLVNLGTIAKYDTTSKDSYGSVSYIDKGSYVEYTLHNALKLSSEPIVDWSYKLKKNLISNTTYTVFIDNPTTPQTRYYVLRDNRNVKSYVLQPTSNPNIFTFKAEYDGDDSYYFYTYAIVPPELGATLTINCPKNIVILEGDHTDKDLSFFEGLKSVGQDTDEISVSSINENLFVLDNLKPNELAKDIIKVENGIICIRGSWGESCTNPMFLKPNTTYFFNAKIRVDKLPTVADSTAEKYSFKMLLHDNKNSKYLSVPGSNNLYEGAKVGDILEYKSSFTTPTDIESYTKLLLYGIKGGDASVTTCGHISILDISVSESDNYVLSKADKKEILYYNPTTQTWEKPILREWDSIEKHSNGKYYYHKRSGEVVLNGSDSQSIVLQKDFVNQDTTIGFNVSRIALDGNSTEGKDNSYCDKFNCYDQNKLHYNDIEGMSQGYYAIYVRINKSKLSTQDVQGFKAWLQANPVAVVYQLAQEEVYECTNLDLITYQNETNLIVNSGAIQPKLELKVLSNISNVVKLLQEKVSVLENKFINGLKQVLAGDMMSLAYLLYPEDFEHDKFEVKTLEEL